MKKNKNTAEQHPFFPSGEWEGFYNYSINPNYKDTMYIHLHFKNGVVTGGGSDEVGGFEWRGTYDTVYFHCKMVKHYATHTVNYDGRADENGIWGTWKMGLQWTGGFHIRPKNSAQQAAVKKVKKTQLAKV
jgi:hypothetical protein